ncbi:MAG: hypothetical protein ACFFCQ_11520 [Promethearchaeota archaeon]
MKVESNGASHIEGDTIKLWEFSEKLTGVTFLFDIQTYSFNKNCKKRYCEVVIIDTDVTNCLIQMLY